MALRKETDAASDGRLARLEEELGNLREEQTAMTSHWQAEKDAIARIRQLKGELEAARSEAERHERAGDLGRASEIRYGESPTSTGGSRRRPTSSPSSRPTEDAERGGRRRGRRRGRQRRTGVPVSG